MYGLIGINKGRFGGLMNAKNYAFALGMIFF